MKLTLKERLYKYGIDVENGLDGELLEKISSDDFSIDVEGFNPITIIKDFIMSKTSTKPISINDKGAWKDPTASILSVPSNIARNDIISKYKATGTYDAKIKLSRPFDYISGVDVNTNTSFNAMKDLMLTPDRIKRVCAKDDGNRVVLNLSRFMDSYLSKGIMNSIRKFGLREDITNINPHGLGPAALSEWGFDKDIRWIKDTAKATKSWIDRWVNSKEWIDDGCIELPKSTISEIKKSIDSLEKAIISAFELCKKNVDLTNVKTVKK